MKYLEEYRDSTLVRQLAQRIRRVTTRPWTLMEICGGQTHAILRFGLDELLPSSITLVHGSGKRQLAIFEDPNCGYCKRFEKDLQKIDNVTIHLFLYPVLGQDSIAKAKTIWCAKDRGKSWTDWMQRENLPSASNVNCDTQAIQRIVEFGRKHKINGTPTLITLDGTRVPGAINANQIERLLTEGKF